jgi:tellurium resistance protein TerD
MSISLTKGDTVDLKKAAADAGSTAPLTKVTFGAGWDAKNGQDIDLDLFAVLIGDDGKAIPDANGNGTNLDEAVLFFKNLSLPGLQHSGDNLTGEGEGDDEQITVDLSSVPANVKEVAITVASYSGQTFGEVDNAFVRAFNADDQKEMAKFTLNDHAADTKGVELGRLKRNGDNWEFVATGSNIAGDFTQIVASYGVSGL